MASKVKVSSRRKYSKVSNEENHAVVIDDDEDDNDFESLKSPTRNRLGEAGASNVASPRFRSPVRTVVTPTSKSKKGVHDEDASLDESWDKLSQGATPSSWSCLLPDYYSSQSEDTVGDVLWDCASPDAIKHLRRRQRGDKSIKEIVKHFNDNGLPRKEDNKGPLLQLDLLRASLREQLQQKQHPRNNANRKQKKLMRQRQQMLASKIKEKLLYGQILSALQKRQELEAQEKKAQENNAQQSESLANPAVVETTSTGALDENVDGNEDSWEDDDLFHDNSFILRATQSPEQFFRNSFTAKSSTPKHAAVSEAREIEECFFDNNSNGSVVDSQNSGVIPSSLMPGGYKFNVKGAASGSSLIGQPNNNKSNFNRAVNDKCVDKVHSVNSLERNRAVDSGSGLRTASSTSHSPQVRTPDSPRSRFQGQRSLTMTPKRLMQKLQLEASNASNKSQGAASCLPCQSQCGAASTHTRHGPSLQSNQQPGRLVPSAAQQNPPRRKFCMTASSAAVSGSSLQEISTQSSMLASTASGNKLSMPSSAKSGKLLQQVSAGSFSKTVISGTSNANSNKLVSVRQPSISSHIKAVCVHNNVQVNKSEAFSKSKTKLNSAQVSAGSKPSVVLGYDLFDDGLSDEFLLKVTEQESTFNSQAIQEYPTQSVIKNSAPVVRLPAKHVEANLDDFDDDLDAEILASICDSFSESPKVAKKSREEIVRGPSDKKQPRMQEAVHAPQKTSSVSSLSTGVNGAKKSNPMFFRNGPVKPSSWSKSKPQNYRNCKPTATLGSVQASSESNLSQDSRQGASNNRLVFPHFAQEKAKPLSSLAGINGVMDKTSQGGKKFVFKPVSSCRSAPVSAQQKTTTVFIKPDSAKDHPVIPGHNPMGTHSHADNDDEMMADDALYESQIIALLDQVESQATQQMASQSQAQTQIIGSSQLRISPPRCSQEQIEKKRQAALEKKLRSKTRTK